MAFNLKQFREFRFGWPVVLASTFGISLGMSPLPFYTIGVFAKPLAAEFGWGIDQIMFGLVPFCVVTVISAPLAGYLSDRYGVRRVALISMVTFSLAMMSFALNNGSHTLYLFLWGLLSILSAGTLPITFTKAISRWFHEKRGLRWAWRWWAPALVAPLLSYWPNHLLTPMAGEWPTSALAFCRWSLPYRLR